MIAADIRPKLARLIRLGASENDGEALNAWRAIKRTLTSSGADLNALADEIETGPNALTHASWIDRPAAARPATAWHRTAR